MLLKKPGWQQSSKECGTGLRKKSPASMSAFHSRCTLTQILAVQEAAASPTTKDKLFQLLDTNRELHMSFADYPPYRSSTMVH